MRKLMVTLAMLLIVSSLSSPALSAGQPGTTDTVFNRKFLHKMQPTMPLERLEKLVGAPGKKVGEDKRAKASTALYHWDGGRQSTLDVKVAAGKVVDLTVKAPKQQKFTLGKKGEVVELGE